MKRIEYVKMCIDCALGEMEYHKVNMNKETEFWQLGRIERLNEIIKDLNNEL